MFFFFFLRNFFVSCKVNVSSVAALNVQFTVTVNSPARLDLGLFLYINALISLLNKLIYFPADES